MHYTLPKIFIFLDHYENFIFKNNNINMGIIYRNYNAQKRETELIKIAGACRANRIKLFVSNDIKLTILINLSDNFTGGETDFPKRNIKAKPKTGKAVLFFNLNDDNTGRRDKSFHAGLPPNTGEKWMCNKWIRMNPHT